MRRELFSLLIKQSLLVESSKLTRNLHFASLIEDILANNSPNNLSSLQTAFNVFSAGLSRK